RATRRTAASTTWNGNIHRRCCSAACSTTTRARRMGGCWSNAVIAWAGPGGGGNCRPTARGGRGTEPARPGSRLGKHVELGFLAGDALGQQAPDLAVLADELRLRRRSDRLLAVAAYEFHDRARDRVHL